MLAIGITGGIGSGKSTVCHLFEGLGIPVYYADDRAKQLMVEDATLVLHIKNIFGEDAYLPDGTLNRVYISKIAFANHAKLEQLNAAVHPLVLADSKHWHQSQKNVPYTIKEAALLVESGGFKQLDKLIVVTAPFDLRLQRVVSRDNVQREQVLARMKAQLPEEEKIKLADFVIQNNGDKALLEEQVLKIHQQLLALY